MNPSRRTSTRLWLGIELAPLHGGRHRGAIAGNSGATRAAAMKRGALGALSCCLGLVSSCGSGFTSDEELIRAFHKHRDEAAELAVMIQTDPCPFVGREGKECPWLGQARVEEYTSRLRQLGAFGVQRGENFASISMSHTSQGDKGFLYSPLRDLPSTPSLDVKPEGESVAWRHLEGPWYLFVDIID